MFPTPMAEGRSLWYLLFPSEILRYQVTSPWRPCQSWAFPEEEDVAFREDSYEVGAGPYMPKL